MRSQQPLSPPPSFWNTGAECEVSARQSSQMEGVEKVTPQRKARERLPEGETDAGRKNSNSVHIGPSVLTTPSKSRVTKQLSKPFPNSVESPLTQPAFPGHLLKHETGLSFEIQIPLRQNPGSLLAPVRDRAKCKCRRKPRREHTKGFPDG